MPVLAVARFVEWSVTIRRLALVLIASVAAESHAIGIYTARPLGLSVDEGRRQCKADDNCRTSGENDVPHRFLSIGVVPNQRWNPLTRGRKRLSLPES